MKKILQAGCIIALFIISHATTAGKHFGELFCNQSDYFCIKIKPQDTWENLFPIPEFRDMVMRINRMNVRLKAGIRLAIPKHLEQLNIYDISPFPRYIDPPGEKLIYVNQAQLAWGAYDAQGELIWWGPISSGVDDCSEKDGCETPSGSFRIREKNDVECVSSLFPKREDGDNGGARMPYCMHFFLGYALHGSFEVPGYRASHGCVRLFIEDARWLNESFIDLPSLNQKGTRVVIDIP